jgi:N-acetylmuramoyl-L-alanine amidase
VKKGKFIISMTPVYALVLAGLIVVSGTFNQVVATLSVQTPSESRRTIIIDAGHGGEDGGATSCTGVLESEINLNIALRLDDMMHLLGMRTIMIRSTDRSVYIRGETMAQKKVSDLQERVRIINETDNALVVSIHQNTFPDGRYWGAQVFYPNTSGSKDLATLMQNQLQRSLMPSNNRKCKLSRGVYLMEHIQCTGLLIECGFLSNPEEEARLRDGNYQKALCAVIGSVCSQYISQQNEDVL